MTDEKKAEKLCHKHCWHYGITCDGRVIICQRYEYYLNAVIKERRRKKKQKNILIILI